MGWVVSATEARIRFGELMQRVTQSHKPIIVERGGRPHVVVLSVVEYERLLAGQQGQEDWKDLVRQARAQVQADLGERELPPSEGILQQIREERILDITHTALRLGLDQMAQEVHKRRQSNAALEQLGHIRETVRRASGVYQGDLVAEARAERRRQTDLVQGIGG